MELAPWQQDHKDVIHQFLKQMNTVSSSFILKGGTALMECYGLDRFSKVEISYRNMLISSDSYIEINGIQVYTMNRLAQLKAAAYLSRDRIRDLYDLCYICNQYLSYLKESTINQVKDAFSYKGFDNFDYITRNESDPFIDKEHLADSYLKAFDRLGAFIYQ